MATDRRRLGLQLYTVRDSLAASLEGTLEAVAAIGYRTVELAGLLGRSSAAFRTSLDAAGLMAPSGHVQYDALGAEWGRTLDEASVMGQTYVVLAAAPRLCFQSRDAVQGLAQRLNEAGEEARRAGLRFAYHNHDFEFRVADGEVPFDALVAACDPGLVELELDLGWVREAGHDPVDVLDRYMGRVPLLHVGEATDGELAGELAAAQRAGAYLAFVEYDLAPPPALDSAERSYRQIRDRW